ncbi:MAG TPA: hypothetical protein VLB83_03155 [Candidatus Paceibacterota bacterium]|nr:hypothetical protein [Candidatus Paceibacterota bacterium]
MALPKRKLRTYQAYYKLLLTPLRTFNDGPARGHQVVLFGVRRKEDLLEQKDRSWQKLMCPCDLEWKWRMWNGKRQLIHTNSDKDRCSAKEHARETVRNELRAEHGARWRSMPLADAAQDIYLMHVNGVYLGEHNVGMLYVQDLERLLETEPEVQEFSFRKNASADVETIRCEFPSRTILDAVCELRSRKLLDLSGMVLVPYTESFRLPDELHGFFASIIEAPLDWSDGYAGDAALWLLCSKIAEKTGWQSGEDVFGKENIPNLRPVLWEELWKEWIPRLDPILLNEESSSSARRDAFDAIPLERWIEWLTLIRDYLAEKRKATENST